MRFVVAAALLRALVAAYDGGARAIRATGRRDLAVALALGACVYATQAVCYFAGLEMLGGVLVLNAAAATTPRTS